MALIPESVLKRVKDHVTSKFPEMKGIEPRIEKISLKPENEVYEKLGITMPKSRASKDIIELQFTTEVSAGDDSKIQRIVRVVVDTSGSILKITTSK
jgi:hypothetical protein